MSADGHYYNHMVAGFLAAISEFPNSSAVVMEINSTTVSYEELELSLVSRNYEAEQTGQELLRNMTTTDKFKAFIKENLPCVNLIKNQLSDFELNFTGALGLLDKNRTEIPTVRYDYPKYYSAIKITAELLRDNYDGVIIVVYHPSMEFESDGTIVWEKEKTYNAFKNALEDTGIIFLDPQDAFQKAYDEKDIVPYGFNNTSPGVGHMNKYGHQIAAEVLYEVLREVR